MGNPGSCELLRRKTVLKFGTLLWNPGPFGDDLLVKLVIFDMAIQPWMFSSGVVKRGYFPGKSPN